LKKTNKFSENMNIKVQCAINLKITSCVSVGGKERGTDFLMRWGLMERGEVGGRGEVE
jgi:hypothetical protein